MPRTYQPPAVRCTVQQVQRAILMLGLVRFDCQIIDSKSKLTFWWNKNVQACQGKHSKHGKLGKHIKYLSWKGIIV